MQTGQTNDILSAKNDYKTVSSHMDKNYTGKIMWLH